MSLTSLGNKLGNGGPLVAIYRTLTVAAILGLFSYLWNINREVGEVKTMVVQQGVQIDKLDDRTRYLERSPYRNGGR